MRIKETFLVPTYYPLFHCKGGSCRHTCCEDLSIYIPMEEYNRLVGLECSSDLRRRLDDALHILPHPTQDRYACISPDFLGRCRMLTEDGLCRLQKEKGFDALTSVCKYFPRSMRFENRQSAISCACEALPEMFLDPLLPSGFLYRQLTFDLWGKPREEDNEDSHMKSKIHLFLVRGFMDFTVPLENRLSWLTASCAKLQEDRSCLSSLTPSCMQEKAESIEQQIMKEKDFLITLFAWIKDHYPTMAEYAEHAEKLLSECNEESLGIAWRRLVRNNAMLETLVNRVLANDLFYREFPFTDGRLSMTEDAEAFRIIVLCYMACMLAMKGDMEEKELVDLTSAFFRMVELTPFSHGVISAVA